MRWFAAIAASSLFWPAGARAQCQPGGGSEVLATAGVSAASGALGALGSSALLATEDHTRDFHFAVGFGAGAGVAAGLSAAYGLIDYYDGCRLVNASGGFAWSVPIVTLVVGAVLPVAIWGAAPKLDAAGQSAAMLRATATRPAWPLIGYRAAF